MENEKASAGPSAFGSLLRRYRMAAGLSQEALAERARISVQGIGALERGDRRTPQRETLTLLTAALALSLSQAKGPPRSLRLQVATLRRESNPRARCVPVDQRHSGFFILVLTFLE